MTYVDPAAARPRAYQRREVPALVRTGANDLAPPTVRMGVELPVAGQGTIGVRLKPIGEFTVAARGGDGSPTLRWTVSAGHVRLDLLSMDGEARPLLSVAEVGLDRSLACPYWFSFDCHNRLIRYGKGEMRLGTTLASCDLKKLAGGDGDGESGDDPWAWLAQIREIDLAGPLAGSVDIWKDPVTIELPMRVVPHDAITMDDIAYGRVAVPASLTPTCQKLYDNVAGAGFILDTPDFPDFSAAIKASILDPNGWCHQVLERKATEFKTDNRKMTYLRITLGTNQGESPGVPFVLEIWPSGNYSPVHNHGGSDAVIRVLHGEITVSLFPFLAEEETKPFAVKTFVKEDVTWISARLNQVHQLRNNNPVEPCITIQCYLYGDEDDAHWPYFDYLGPDRIEHFDPNSDDDFLTFKDRMKREWAGR